MKDIDLDIDMALKVPISHRFCEYGPVFSNTCENLSEVENILNYNNKSVLVPLSSGDQYLFSIYKNASKVTTYDINKLTKYYANLKIACIKKMENLNDYLKFLITDKYNLFDSKKELIYKVLDNLDKDDLYFWKNYLLKASKIQMKKLITNKTNRFDIDYVKCGIPFLCSDTEYKILRNKLLNNSEINFINTDLYDISDKLDEKFDVIDLSNIISTDICNNLYDDIYDGIDINWEYVLKNEIIPFLNSNGSLIIDYAYETDSRKYYQLFESNKIKEYKIKSKNNTHDSIYVYKKG